MTGMTPPMPPYLAQQMTPMGQFISGVAGMPTEQLQTFNASEFALQKLTESLVALNDAAKVLATHKPAMLGVVEVTAKAMQALMAELEADVAKVAPAPDQAQPPVGEPQPQTGAQAISMS